MQPFLAAVVLLQLLPFVQTEGCLNTLQEMEASLQKNALNIESIDNAFFPLNSHPSLAVYVRYFVNETTRNGTASVPKHPTLMTISDLEYHPPNYLFQWVISPVLLPFGPELLELRGLAIITPIIPTAYVVIESTCPQDINSNSRIEKLLTRLTSKVNTSSVIMSLSRFVS